MSLLYKPKAEQTIEVAIEILKDKSIILDFYLDCGKFGTYESLAGFKLSAERLLQIIQETDLPDEEYN
jgi:aspartyl/asparaginyl-tRNA synthetase